MTGQPAMRPRAIPTTGISLSRMLMRQTRSCSPPLADDGEDSASELDLSDSGVTERLRVGTETIARFASTLPNSPGVYRMFDKDGEVLYVGKARSLKKRVTQYAQGRAHTNRVARMIVETASMAFVTTATEMEALLLEANLIKQLRPRYNVLLRDDKSFPYIMLTRDHASPQLTKHRGARTRKARLFRAICRRWCGQSHDQCVAAGFFGSHLCRFRL